MRDGHTRRYHDQSVDRCPTTKGLFGRAIRHEWVTWHEEWMNGMLQIHTCTPRPASNYSQEYKDWADPRIGISCGAKLGRKFPMGIDLYFADCGWKIHILFSFRSSHNRLINAGVSPTLRIFHRKFFDILQSYRMSSPSQYASIFAFHAYRLRGTCEREYFLVFTLHKIVFLDIKKIPLRRE